MAAGFMETKTTKSLLVVDDNRDAVTVLQRLLQLKGYRVHSCFDGLTGLAAAERLQPDALLLDLAMPGLDGFSLCQAIRVQPWGEQLLIIALSGYSSLADQQRSQAAGFDLHLTKPVDLVTLTHWLDERLV